MQDTEASFYPFQGVACALGGAHARSCSENRGMGRGRGATRMERGWTPPGATRIEFRAIAHIGTL